MSWESGTDLGAVPDDAWEELLTPEKLRQAVESFRVRLGRNARPLKLPIVNVQPCPDDDMYATVTFEYEESDE